MKIVDLYNHFMTIWEKSDKSDLASVLSTDERLKSLRQMALEWEMDLENIERWMKSSEYEPQNKLAKRFVLEAPTIVQKIETLLSEKLQGEIRLSPSLMRFDGFARYDSGYHTVWFGVDHPDADDDYLRVLLSHELSHVYRDHSPQVWAHLKKPLKNITRQEYLDNTSALEHLVSEGLATLFSQVVYPQVPLHVHHYYFAEEMEWCMQNFGLIDKAIKEKLRGDGDIWSFYAEDAVAPGSPSRTQYFWAARVLDSWIRDKFSSKNFVEAVIELHGWPAEAFDCFKD